MSAELLAERAAILAESMPHLRRYMGKIVVIKFGGHAMIDERPKAGFAADVVLLQQCGLRLVIVHGGGPQIELMLDKLKIESHFINGLRVTSPEAMEIAEMILAGSINKNIVALIHSAGGNALGMCGKDGHTLVAQRMVGNNQGQQVDLGLVGEPEQVDTRLISHLLDGGFIPVIAPIGLSRDGETLNINSDTVAGAIAAKLCAKRLLLLSDIPGVLDHQGQLISTMSTTQAEAALSNGIATGGMIPKLQTCLKAVHQGLEAAVILDGRNDHATLMELLSDQGSGTLIAHAPQQEAN